MRLALMLLTVGCSDYSVVADKGGNGGADDTGDGGDTEPGSDTGSDPGVPRDTGTTLPGEYCELESVAAADVGTQDTCPEVPAGGFTPVAEWEFGAGSGCLSLPAVGDIDLDGIPDIAVNLTSLFGGAGTLSVVSGDGSRTLWTDSTAALGYGSGPLMVDLEGDGLPEILGVREYANSLFGAGDYTVVAWDSGGTVLWESDHFTGSDFDYATGLIASDMDHDGATEIIAGRAILNYDGSTRGLGAYGRGSYGISGVGGFVISEASVPAVVDIDGDGFEEVIVGNAAYDADGAVVWVDPSLDDAMIGIAELDGDPEGEIVAVSFNTVRAMNHDFTPLWGPKTLASANILSVPTIGDLDGDGQAEIVVAGGNQLQVLNHDGSVLWTATVTDESGATGASIFDFDGDGVPEVVYIDEVEMAAYDGATGALKFYNTDHMSNTMMDYPVIADVDADGQAEIVVCHNGFGAAMTVYGDQASSWPPARQVWNQHAYSINNVQDDLSVPVTAIPAYSDHNTWHSAMRLDGDELVADVIAEIVDVCVDDCALGVVYVTVSVANVSVEALTGDVQVALYALSAGVRTLVASQTVAAPIASGWSADSLLFEVDAAALVGADGLRVVVDDDGTGAGVLRECDEDNNVDEYSDALCE